MISLLKKNLSLSDVVLFVEDWRSVDPSPFSAGLLDLVKAAGTLGIEVVYGARNIVDRVTPVPEGLSDRPVITYGSIQFCRDIKETLIPGAYGLNGTDWINISYNIPRSWLVNSAFILATWGDLKANFKFYEDMLGSWLLHIRPASDKKTFAGQVASSTDLLGIEQTSSVVDSTLCVVSRMKFIGAESRFFIVDRKVVSTTVYSPVQSGVSQSVSQHERGLKRLSMAEKVAALDWQPDTCYTCDITLVDNEPLIVELNGFASAGLYGCSPVAVLEAVAGQAIRDFEQA